MQKADVDIRRRGGVSERGRGSDFWDVEGHPK